MSRLRRTVITLVTISTVAAGVGCGTAPHLTRDISVSVLSETGPSTAGVAPLFVGRTLDELRSVLSAAHANPDLMICSQPASAQDKQCWPGVAERPSAVFIAVESRLPCMDTVGNTARLQGATLTLEFTLHSLCGSGAVHGGPTLALESIPLGDLPQGSLDIRAVYRGDSPGYRPQGFATVVIGPAPPSESAVTQVARISSLLAGAMRASAQSRPLPPVVRGLSSVPDFKADTACRPFLGSTPPQAGLYLYLSDTPASSVRRFRTDGVSVEDCGGAG